MFKPMLAETLVDIESIVFPVYASIKLDGIRCLIVDGEAVTRSLKPIGNRAIRESLSRHTLNGLDGEILTYHPDGRVKTLNEINGDVSRADGEAIWQFHAFDICDQPKLEFRFRVDDYVGKARSCGHSQVRAVEQRLINSLPELIAFEESAVLSGHEGIMIRSIRSPYKFGRSTLKEAWLLKIKRFVDDEAILTGMEELMHNGNEGFTNELGRTARSTAKDGLRPAGVMGALELDWNGVPFKIGTGFSAADRADLWHRRDQLRGSKVTFKYKGVGTNGRPLIASFRAIRTDM